MTSDLPVLLGAGAVAEQTVRLRELATWVAGAGEPDAADTAIRANQLRAYVKAVKGAHEIAVEATKLECAALRRLAILGSPAAAGKERKAAAERFGAMSEEQFARCMASVSRFSGAIGVHRAMLREEQNDRFRADGARIAAGQPSAPISDPRSLSDLVSAAAAMLEDFTPEGQPFALVEVAARVAEATGADSFAGEPAMREGYIEAVRLALRIHDRVPSGAPRWVTYHEDAIGWVRVPFRSASIEQLKAMVELRERQAKDLADAADNLADLLSALTATAKASHPRGVRFDDLSCARLYEQMLERAS